MPKIVGIFTFISRMNKTAEKLKTRIIFIFQRSSFYEQLKFNSQLSWAWKQFYNWPGPVFDLMLIV